MSRLGSLAGPGRDGRLVVVSDDATRFLPGPVPTLQAALESWGEIEERLDQLSHELSLGGGAHLPEDELLAPLPRAVQYLEGSTYLAHMERGRRSRGAKLPPGHGVDLAVYQGASDRFLGPREACRLGDPRWDLDLEATVGVVVDDVPAGVGPREALTHVRLVVLINDFTLRAVLPIEFERGLGFVQAKPLRSFAPFAVTPERLGSLWEGGLLHATVRVWVNDVQLGVLDSGADCSFDFGQIISHSARTRPLAAGTVLTSGTVSNRDDHAGFGCLIETRAQQAIEGRPQSEYLRTGDRVRIVAEDARAGTIFGAIDNLVTGPRP